MIIIQIQLIIWNVKSISIVGNYSVYVNNTYTGKILDIKNEIIPNNDDDISSSSNINYIKFKILYLFYIIIFFYF